MKKILFIILIAIILISCKNGTIKDSVKNPIKETTIELQQLPKDTVIVSIHDDKMYIFEDNLVVAKTYVVEGDYIIVSKVFVMLGIISIMTLLIMVLISLLN